MMDWARSSGTGPTETAAPAHRAAPAAPAAPSRSRGEPSRRAWLLPVAGLALLAVGAAGYLAWTSSRTPKVEAVTPARVRVGDTLTLTGANLGESAGDVTVTIGGKPAKVAQAAGSRLSVAVPEIATAAGRDIPAPIVVSVSGRQSAPATVAVFQSPRIAALAPDVGMPGDEVVVTGPALDRGATVLFGAAQAEVVQAGEGSIRVRVPPDAGPAGAEVPVVVALGADQSNAAPFLIGRVPIVTSTDVRNASPGQLVTVAGRGFDPQPQANRVTVGGVPALVVSSSVREIKIVVPRAPASAEATVRVAVPGSANAGEAPLAVDPVDDPIGFRFVAEPFVDAPGHEHAALSTGLGPAFILTSGAGKSAAERAYEAQRKLNDAAADLASSREADIRAQFDPAPGLYLYGRGGFLLDVTEADAAGYEEDWSNARGRGRAVTAPRLAVWWEAVARDLVLLLVRGAKPAHAAALAPEGKVLADLHDAARRTVAVGVPASLVGERAALREGLRVLALRVPATVSAPAASGAAAAAAGTAAPPGTTAPPADATPPLRLDGTWNGIETEGALRKSINVSIRGASGTMTYQRALAMSVPVLNASQPQKGVVRFEVPTGGGRRYYRGRWDGAKVTGKVYSDPDGRREVGSFEIRKD
jgi:hypothetical protein